MLLRKTFFTKKVMENFKNKICFSNFMVLIRAGSISTRMIVSDRFETQHVVNITRLVQQFGEEREEEIRRLYETERGHLEERATMPDFIPLVIYNKVNEKLREMYG